MKAAGVLAILLALVLGVWDITDNVQLQHAKERNVQQLQSEVTQMFQTGSSSGAGEKESDRINSEERFELIIAIVSAAALIAGIALFANSGGKDAA